MYLQDTWKYDSGKTLCAFVIVFHIQWRYRCFYYVQDAEEEDLQGLLVNWADNF